MKILNLDDRKTTCIKCSTQFSFNASDIEIIDKGLYTQSRVACPTCHYYCDTDGILVRRIND